MDLAAPNPVKGEVFNQMNFHCAASAPVQGTSLGFFSSCTSAGFCKLQVQTAGYG